MTERDALLRAVLAHPHEDTPRLVLADGFDEDGEPERAAFIRGQIAGRKVPIQSRQARQWFAPWWAGDGAPVVLAHARGQTKLRPPGTPAAAVQRPDTRPCMLVRRGFVDEIRCPLATFLEHAEAIFRSHPITRVVLTDREPMEIRRRVRGHDSSWAAPEHTSVYDWHRATIEACRTGEPDYIPECVFDRLPGRRPQYTLHPSLTVPLSMRYDTVAEATIALSAACVAYERELAGLPTLQLAEA